MNRRAPLAVALAAAPSLFFVPCAFAQDADAGVDAPPESAAPVEPAAQFTQATPLAHPATDETIWNVSAGATVNSGNTRSFAGNVGTHFALRRGPHSVGVDAQFIEGYAQMRDTGTLPTSPYLDWTENARNVTGAVRYDFFFDANNALFVGLAGRHDQFAGLDFRGQAQVGYLRNLYVVEKHRLWGEVGYDFTYDDFSYAHAPPPAGGTVRLHDRTVHSARFYVGYDNHLNDALTLTTGVEVLFRPYAVTGQGDFQVRLAWITQLNVKIDTRFSLGLNFTLRYDSVPPGSATDNVDTTTVLNLIYTFV